MVWVAGMGVGVGAPLVRTGCVPTNTGKVTACSWPLVPMAYAAKSTPRPRFGTCTSRLQVPELPGTALPRKVPPSSRGPRNRSTRSTPEPDSTAVPEMIRPPAGRSSPGLGLPSDRLGQAFAEVRIGALAAAAPAVGAGAVVVDAAGAAVGQLLVAVGVRLGAGVGVTTPAGFGSVPTKTGNVTVVSAALT